jgi:hypothetical protein
MAQAEGKPARRKRERKTLVRGADGALYLLTKTNPPMKLTEKEARTLTEVLEVAEEKLAKIIDKEIPRFALNCTHTVQITLPEVFME